MPDLKEHDVSAMAGSLGFTLTPDDLTEVTHRLNAFVDALRPVSDLPLDEAEPVPAPVDPDGAV